ncbi:MAG: O-antigen ligase family protein [Gammaproteobacteria bacterium]|nr:O-antigen ligase family protein [Gammaproteobacteria bacterium]
MVFAIGMSVLLLAVMGTSVRHVSSTMFAVLFLLSLSTIRYWKKTYLTLSGVEKMFVAALLLYTFSCALSFYNVDDARTYFKVLERYLRFAMIIPVFFLLVNKRISLLNYLYLGAIISGPFLFIIALQHYLADSSVPAKGYYHHIIFGQLAMLNVGIMLSMLLTKNLKREYQLIISISMLCGVAAAVLSQARGVWLVLPVYLFIGIFYAVKEKRLDAKAFAFVIIAIVGLTLLTPVGELIKQRTDEAIAEVNGYYNDDNYKSSVGGRLAMWKIAIDVWKQHPLLGSGPGDFDDEIIALNNKGEYRGIAVHNSVHNIYLQSLADLGIVGLAALLFVIIIMPLRLLFYEEYKNEEEGRLVWFMILTSYAIFGLSESWTLRSPAISVFLVYLTVVAAHLKITASKNQG